MQIIKLAIISFVGLFALVTAISLLFPSTVIVSRAIDINASADSINTRINNFDEWKLWVEGMKDTSVIVYSSAKAKLGKTMVVIDSVTTTKISSTWVATNGRVMQAFIQIIPSTNQNIQTVHWQFQQHLHWYPWEKFASMMNDKILGTMMEKNLQHLKKLVEQNQPL
jgi:hypothetical protein